MNKLVKTQLVKVYTDPITCVIPEGNATLIRKIDDCKPDPHIEHFTVHFLGDDNSQLVDRYINLFYSDPF